MAQVYISYSRQQQPLVNRLVEDLRAAGFEVWIDLENLRPNTDWYTHIRQALNASDFLLLLVSPDSMASSVVESEWRTFLEQGKPIFQMLAAPCEGPLELQGLPQVDATDPQHYTSALKRVLYLLESELPSAPGVVREAQRQQIEQVIQRVSEQQWTGVPAPPDAPDAGALLAQAQRYFRNNASSRAAEVCTQVLLDRGDPGLRVQAVEMLGKLRAAAGDLIQNLWTDPSPEVRAAVVRALASFQGPLTDEALQIAAVLDKSLDVRVYARLVTFHFKQPGRIPTWLNLLAGSGDARLRTVAHEAQLFANELARQPGHVFISYSRQDAEAFALQLVDTLRTRNKFRVWVDTNLTPGTENWKIAIAKAIEQCSLLVMILSPAVHESKWIREEVAYAEQLGKERLYVIYQETHKPFGMTDMQGLRRDLTFEAYPDEMLAALVAEFERRNIPRIEA